MNYLNTMYGKKHQQSSTDTKNPNRVAGGLKGQGVDHFELLGEDGVIQKIPTQRYVQALEAQLRVQREALSRIEKKMYSIRQT